MMLRSSIATEVPHLRRFARALTGDPVYADDLVQDCVERALTRLHLFDKSRNLRVWLFTILRNIHVNEKRKQARHGVSVDIDDARGSELAQNPVQGDRLALREVADAVLRLPIEQREVLLLITLEGLSYNETSEALGIPAGTVMSRLSRARRHLSRILADDEQPQLRRVK